jgi:very-short-patch-repair endonuclease
LEEGIPVTAVARTLLDLAALVRRDSLDRLIERAEELKRFDLGQVEGVLARNRGHHGACHLDRAVAAYRPPPFTRSKTERRFLELLAQAGLPRPATGYNLRGHEVDFYWPELRFAVELDLFETHGTRAAFGRDRVRREDLMLDRIEVANVTGERLDREPARVVERIARLLELRRAEL